jgi:hypothetical protein
MGTWISYRHRTKNLALIKTLINDLKIFAENTGRGFKVMNLKGFSAERSNENTTAKDRLTSYQFREDSSYDSDKNVVPSQELYFEIEIKSARTSRNKEWYGVGWHLRDGYWIANDGRKIYPVIARDKVVGSVIEIIGILEYIKSRYFPDFKIDDQFDFHVNYDEKTDAEKEHNRICSAGYFEYLRQKDGTFKDYKAEYLRKKNHDIQNILDEVRGMDQVTSFVKSELMKKGFKPEQFVDPKVFFNRYIPSVKGSISSFIPEGNNMIKTFHNTIDDTLLRVKRKRVLTLRTPKSAVIRKVLMRKDGVSQRYHIRIEDKRQP